LPEVGAVTEQPPARPGAAATGGRGLVRRLIDSRDGFVLAGVALLLLLGLMILTDFGSSTDEWQNAHMGAVFLKVYETGSLFRSPGINYFNGPFYFMLFTVTSSLARLLNPAWLLSDGLHLTNYVTFLVGLLFFYRLALRLLPRNVALFTTALFCTQPLIFGHAFINQKDIPFLVFFLASVETGWTAVDSLAAPFAGGPASASPARGSRPASRPSRPRAILIIVAGLAATATLLVLWGPSGVKGAADRLLAQAYQGQGPRAVTRLFSLLAQDAYKTPLEAYLAKFDSLFSWARLAAGPILLFAVLALWRVALPASFAATVGRFLRRWGMTLLAGVVLGLTTSIRLIGPLAGGLVTAYWFARLGRRGLAPWFVYAGTAAFASYATWPALWGNPLLALADRVAGLSEFAGHYTLFRGVLVPSGETPFWYLPTLFALQLTLPALALFLLGLVFSWWPGAEARRRWLPTALVWLWFWLPAVAVLVGIVPVYNNQRHVLFVYPAAFLIIGFGASRLTAMIRTAAIRWGLAFLCLLPGIVGILRLHPYEYIYYNELVGGVRGAAGRYELDYFCSAFRAAMAVVNERAKPEARVAVSPYLLTAAPYAREDLKLKVGGIHSNPDFAMECRENLVSSSFFPDYSTIWEVRADGALLAVVKERPGDLQPQIGPAALVPSLALGEAGE